MWLQLIIKMHLLRINFQQLILYYQSKELLGNCEAHVAHAGNNYYSFLWTYFKSHRAVLFNILKTVSMHSTNPDEKKVQLLKLSLIPDSWLKLVTEKSNRHEYLEKIDRRNFEVCLFTQIM